MSARVGAANTLNMVSCMDQRRPPRALHVIKRKWHVLDRTRGQANTMKYDWLRCSAHRANKCWKKELDTISLNGCNLGPPQSIISGWSREPAASMHARLAAPTFVPPPGAENGPSVMTTSVRSPVMLRTHALAHSMANESTVVKLKWKQRGPQTHITWNRMTRNVR